MEGRIKLHRQIQERGRYHKSEMVHLFLHLVLNANHKEGIREGEIINRGQLVVGREKLAESTGITEQTIRTCIERLKSTNEITIKSTNKYSIITIIKYDDYNDTENKSTSKSTSKSTNNQPTTNQQLTTNKNDKNDKNEKEVNFGFSEEIENLIQEYNKGRKKKLEKLTDRGIALRKKNLIEFGGGTDEGMRIVLEKSISNGYEGIFEVKGFKKRKELTDIEIGNLWFQKTNPDARKFIDEYKLENKYTQDQLEGFRKKYLYSIVNQKNG